MYEGIIGFEFYILFDHGSIAFKFRIWWKNVCIDRDVFCSVDLDSGFLALFCPVSWFFV